MKRFAFLLSFALAAPVLAQSGFMPRQEDVEGVDAWFAQYDALSKKGDVEGMANMALFPITVISDDSTGNGQARTWTREQFVKVFRDVTKNTPKDLQMKSTRKPFFLTDNLVVVTTESTMTVGQQPAQTMRYADILVKRDGKWLFQTMAQGGWGEMLNAEKVKRRSAK